MNSLPLFEKIIEDLGFYVYPNIDGTFTFGDSLKKIDIGINQNGFVINSIDNSIAPKVRSKIPSDLTDLDKVRSFLADLREILNEQRLGVTREIRARVNQHKYRSDMLKLWGGCAVTGIKTEDFIVASHAKPYSVCSIEESDNAFNGLPLLVHLDRLFDSGYIAFDRGDILISSKLPDELIVLWNLNNLRLQKIIDEVEPFLKWHRENIFLK